MITKHDLKPGVKFKTQDSPRVKTITSICKSRDIYSVDISYKYSMDNDTIKYDSLLLDKEDLNYLEILE